MELYDKKDPKSIERYGKGMIGKTFRQIWKENAESGSGSQTLMERTETSRYAERHSQKRYKGGMGNLVEECYFKYKSNSDSNPDFPEAGVELKVTPYKMTKKGMTAKERLILTMINYGELVKEPSFEESHVWQKSKLILLVWYLYQSGMVNLDFHIDFVNLFTPPPEDIEIIKEDYRKIQAKVRAGKAHELSEGDTLYLGAATKSSDSSKRTEQPYSDIKAKPRAFSYKNSYMNHILNCYISQGIETYEPIVRKGEHFDDFEGLVISKIDAYRGKSVPELCQIFNIDITKKRPKNLESMLAFRMLGVKGNQAEEFAKAGIVVKAIRIERSGIIEQSMSFPIIDYQQLAEETWDDCTFGNYLRETRFFFVIYKKDNEGVLHLSGSQFWNIPEEDLEGDVRAVWQETHDIVKNSRLEIHVDAKGKIHNNLPKQKDHPVSHVRPHGRDKKDTRPLPEGTHLLMDEKTRAYWPDDTRYVKQCFWLNNIYIKKQIKEENR